MDKQYYVIRVNRSLIQYNWDKATLERFQKTSEQRALNDFEKKHVAEVQARVDAYESTPKVFGLHSGGKGNGACGGVYEKHQLNRILGRYDKGVAEALPIAIGVTDEDAEDAQEDQAFLECLRAEGVDNWDGYEFAQERYRAEGGHDD